MAYYSDIVVDDQTKAARAGVSITVLKANGTLAALTDGSGAQIPQPLMTNATGFFSFNATDAVYTIEFRYGGRLVREDEVIVGLPPEFVGPPGPIANVINALGQSTVSAPSQKAVSDGLALKASNADLSGKVARDELVGINGSTVVGFSQAVAAPAGTVAAKSAQSNNPLDAPYLASGNGTNNDRSALAATDAFGPVEVTANHRISSDITFNGLVTFRGRGRLTIDAGVTVTFKRQIVAPCRQIFYGTGAVAGLPSSRLEWFVGDADAPAPTTECGAGVRRWLNSTVNDGELKSMPMRLLVDGSAPYDVSKGQSFVGPGQWQLFFCWQGAACNGFRFTAGSVDGAQFSGFQWRMNIAGVIPSSGTAIDVQSSYVTLSDFFINDCYDGLNLGQSVVTYVDNFQILGSVNSGLKTNENTLDYHVRNGIVQALYDWITLSSVSGTFNAGDNFTLSSGQTGTIQEKYDATHYRVRFVGPMPTLGATISKSGASATIAAIQVGHQQGGVVMLDTAEAVTMQSMDVLGGRKSLVSFTSGGQPRDGLTFSRFTNVYFDSSYEGSNLVNAYGIVFLGGWFASSANVGAKGLILNGCRRIMFMAPQFVNNADCGLSILSNCQDIEVHGILCDGNNTLGGPSEVYVQGGAVNVKFIGGKAGYQGANGVNPPKSFYIDTGASNKFCMNCVDVPSGTVTNLNTATEQTFIGISGIAFRNL